ncbi:hypothetical protein JK159_02370 [Weissella minor]|uniref:hypothetical protein n=1 Tax=Weissella minor TaxID=1620 RepID=UPI001BAE963B|nr:hypothetical protein [Weissella minor]MBS0949228.1 hypothetical protein [Weissella minor]
MQIGPAKDALIFQYQLLDPNDETETDENLVIVLEGMKQTELFPAGLPVLGHKFILKVDAENQRQNLLSSFDVDAEVIPASVVVRLEHTEYTNLKGQDLMDYTEVTAKRNATIEQIRQDDRLQAELAQADKEEMMEAQSKIKKRLSATGIEKLFENDAAQNASEKQATQQPENKAPQTLEELVNSQEE